MADDLQNQVHVHLHEIHGGRQSREDIAQAAISVAADLKTREGPDTEPIDVDDVLDLHRDENLMRPVRLRGRLTAESPRHQTLMVEDEGWASVPTRSVSLLTTSGAHVACLPVVGPQVWDLPLAAPVTVLGRMARVPVDRRFSPEAKFDRFEAQLCIETVEECRSHLDLIGATPKERERTEAVVRKLAECEGGLYDNFARQVREALGILETGHALRLAQYAVILQAFGGDDRVGQSPGRTSVLLVGPPGQGKKTLTTIARCLNSAFVEMSPERATAAGLCGPSHRARTGWASTPGAIAHAANGVLALQDAHSWTPSKLNSLAPILQTVMEDGAVRNQGVSGGSDYSANVGLLLDANRHEQVIRGTRTKTPILCHGPLLSRFDSIIELPLDVDGAWARGGKLVTALAGQQETHPQLARTCQLVVAYLKDKHPAIDTGGVGEALEHIHQELFDAYRHRLEVDPNLAAAMPNRLAVQLVRWTRAYARANDRSVATVEDTEAANTLADAKLKFVCQAVETNVRMSECPNHQIDHVILQRAGETVTPAEIVDAVRQDLGREINERTARRHLKQLGEAVKHGHYAIPGHDA